MKAIVVHEFGPPDVMKFEEIATPEPGEGEVLVRVGLFLLTEDLMLTHVQETQCMAIHCL